jgi:predicted nucleotidyltransferase component of viral defense system
MNQRNLGASVRQRLLAKAHAEKRPFQELLQYYAMERFLYRLAQSPHAKSFVLKGALFLTAWRAPLSRPTMDIDFAGKTSNDLDHIREVIAEVCDARVEDDGIEFVSSSISASRIKEDADYEGVRIRFHGLLAGARIPWQIDIGFGDVIVPEVVLVTYLTLLEFPNPVLTAYPKETVIAEKLEALTSLGLLNSRMKDYFDLWLLSRLYEFDGGVLLRAIMATFRHRETTLEFQPVGLTDEFASDPAKDTQWKAFCAAVVSSPRPKH